MTTTWQKCRDVCMLRIVLATTRDATKRNYIEFGSYVSLKIWQKALPLVDNIHMPIFNITGGVAKTTGFVEDYAFDCTFYFSVETDIEKYLSEHLPLLELPYLEPKVLLQKRMIYGDVEKTIQTAPPQTVANIGQLLLSEGRIEEGLRCLEEYARKPFDK